MAAILFVGDELREAAAHFDMGHRSIRQRFSNDLQRLEWICYGNGIVIAIMTEGYMVKTVASK